jgi:SH3-like domain-containing protein
VPNAFRSAQHVLAPRQSSSSLAVIVALAILVAAIPVRAAEKDLPVPRFVTLRSDKVNLRTGPGEQYPIDWVLTRKGMPVEIVAEFNHWHRIRDVDGTEGWVQERMVRGQRAVIVRGQERALRERPSNDAEIVARAEPGVIAELSECQPAWCRIKAGEISGWLKRDEFWGVYPGEVVQ